MAFSFVSTKEGQNSRLFGSHKWIQIPHSDHHWGLGLVGDLMYRIPLGVAVAHFTIHMMLTHTF